MRIVDFVPMIYIEFYTIPCFCHITTQRQLNMYNSQWTPLLLSPAQYHQYVAKELNRMNLNNLQISLIAQPLTSNDLCCQIMTHYHFPFKCIWIL